MKISCISIHTNELSKKEIKKAIPFTIASITTKYLGISISPKKMKNLYTEKHKRLMKEIGVLESTSLPL